MAEYFISIDNEEESELADRLSITGTVNSVPCAASLRLNYVRGLSKKDAKLAKQTVLAASYEARTQRKSFGAEKVNL